MCDMQKMPTRDDASCDEDSDMNFAAYPAGTHFVTTGGQLPVTKLQQTVTNNGTSLSQVVGMVSGVNMGEGVQYVRAIDSSTLQGAPQLISVPIALPGVKPGDPQPTVQIQVLGPNLTLQQQQPKYQMQIPIQGFQQGGQVLTVAYSPEANETGGIQLIGNTLPDGLQVLTMPQEMQLMQQDNKEHIQPNIQHQIFITPNNQIVINGPDKNLNNNTSANNNNEITTNIVIKEECDDNMDDLDVLTSIILESGPGSLKPIRDLIHQLEARRSGGVNSDIIDETSQGAKAQQDFVKYLNNFRRQQTPPLPASLQQFLRLNPATEFKKTETVEIEVPMKEVITEAVLEEDGTLRVQTKKKKKYRKKAAQPARPKLGQVVIATSADGTPIFCCPQCDMAYPEKEQLEMHLSAHKIERRFICGICGAGLKRKEHLERHKLGHNPERPYVCGSCGKGFKRREHLNLHAVIHSGVKTEMCGECGKGFYRKDHLRKHTRSHESKRARDEANNEGMDTSITNTNTTSATTTTTNSNSILPEITIHVPTSSNMQVPVQINIPQHVMSSLVAAQAAHTHAPAHTHAHDDAGDAHAQLDALLAQHT